MRSKEGSFCHPLAVLQPPSDMRVRRSPQNRVSCQKINLSWFYRMRFTKIFTSFRENPFEANTGKVTFQAVCLSDHSHLTRSPSLRCEQREAPCGEARELASVSQVPPTLQPLPYPHPLPAAVGPGASDSASGFHHLPTSSPNPGLYRPDPELGMSSP